MKNRLHKFVILSFTKMSMTLGNMTENILCEIKSYLQKGEEWQLYMSNHLIRHELKNHIIFRLNHAHSQLFVSDCEFNDKILTRISFPNKQLSLNLEGRNVFYALIRRLSGLYALNFLNCEGMINDFVFLLGNVHDLDISDCLRVTDVSSLGNVHTLNLSGCIHIMDVSSLGNVHTLNLSGCLKVTNVSSLGNVCTLNLSGCLNVTDVSALGNVHTLDLSDCYYILDVSHLGRVHTLNLTRCYNIRDVSNLGGVYSLNLTGCLLKDVSALRRVPYLNLDDCTAIEIK